ncbi:PhoH family protein [Candidatus Woesearchaeota archaeon]|nr:PhoH family protein [Candidatus Woesearchaeota archaeon]
MGDDDGKSSFNALEELTTGLDSLGEGSEKAKTGVFAEKPKIWFVDTNSIIDNPKCLIKLGEGGNCVVLPTPVLYEIDKHAQNKKDPSVAVPAREARRIIRDLILEDKLYHSPDEALKVGAKPSFDNGGKFSWSGAEYKPIHSKEDADDQIIEQIMQIKKKLSGYEVRLSTEDAGMMAKASSQGIPVEPLRMGKVPVKDKEQIYSGVNEYFVSRELLDKFLKSGSGLERYLLLNDLKTDQEKQGKAFDKKFIWNQGIILIDKDKTNDYLPTVFNAEQNRLECLKYAIGALNYKSQDGDQKNKKNELFSQNFFLKTFFDTQPRDVYQLFYMEYLINPNIHFIVVNGRSGTGKTRLAMAGALHLLLREDKMLEMLQERNHFGKNDVMKKKDFKKGLLILKPEIASMDYGFLPGNLDEKIEPYLTPFYDEIKEMTEKYSSGLDFLQHLKSNGLLRTEATAFLRGRSLGDMITVIDELQNGNRALAKLYISRLDHGSKNIAMGDVNQIDNDHVGVNNNALTLLTDVIQKRPRPEVAVIRLEKSQRLGWAAQYEDMLVQ